MGATRAWTDSITGSSYMCMDHQHYISIYLYIYIYIYRYIYR